MWGQALNMFHSMKQERTLPSVIIHTTLISACGKVRQTKRAMEIFDAM